jgi:hypothetical protein
MPCAAVTMAFSGVVVSAFGMGEFRGGGFAEMNRILAYTANFSTAYV